MRVHPPILLTLLYLGCASVDDVPDTGSADDTDTDTADDTDTDTDADADTDTDTDTDSDTGAPELDPDLAPGENFDLTRWKITFPDASEEKEAWLAAGGTRPGEFFTDETTGGMVFRAPNLGGSTPGSSYTRSELREMLRAGDTSIATRGANGNNWVLSTSDASVRDAAGGVNGTLTATLRVDHVSTSGDDAKVGRVIVGQIHGSKDEPCRLYYRLLPGHERGSVYFAHDPNIGDERFVEILGSRAHDAPEPADGITLGERWSYVIDASGSDLTVTIMREGKPDAVATLDMSAGGFANDWMYFKAGVYNQNNTGSSDDYAQATFFALEHAHD